MSDSPRRETSFSDAMKITGSVVGVLVVLGGVFMFAARVDARLEAIEKHQQEQKEEQAGKDPAEAHGKIWGEFRGADAALSEDIKTLRSEASALRERVRLLEMGR